MKHFRLTQTTLGQRIGFTKGYLSLMMSDKEPISTKVIEGLIKSFAGLNIHWLLTGEGEMFLAEGGIKKQLKSGVEEPDRPVYGKIALDDLPAMLERMEREMQELREEVKRLKEGKKG